MAQSGFAPIQHYRSATPAAIPLAANLTLGELALNYADGRLYYKDATNTVRLLTSAAAVGTVTSVSGTGAVNGLTLTGTVTSSGNLTLGGTLSNINLTTQTTGTLDVNRGGTGATSFTSGVLLKGNGTGVLAPSLFSESGSTMSLFGNLLFASGTPTLTFNTGGPVIASPAGGTLTVSTSGVERLRVTNVGDLGIGVTPGYRLDLAAADTTAGVGYGARLRANASANAVSIQFTDSGASTERAIITSTNTSFALRAGGARSLIFGTNGAQAGEFDTSQNLTVAGNITANSDERLKDNIQTITKALDKVEHMRGVTFTRKATGAIGTGVVAQELLTVMPEAVIVGEEYMSVAYGNLVGVLIEAIKELSAEVKQLKGQLP